MHGETDLTGLDLARLPLESVPGLSFLKDDQVVRTSPRPFVADLDSIPFPARDLLKNDLYVRADTGRPQATIQANRGCPHSCIFCAAPLVSGTKFRARSHDNILSEIRECITRHGIRDFHFRGDTFTLSESWTEGLCRVLLGSGLKIDWVCNSRADTVGPALLGLMKKAGCWGISFGVESAGVGAQEQMGKGLDLEAVRRAVEGCRQNGIRSLLYFIVGFPWDSAATIRETAEFARQVAPDFAEFFFAYPLPGTRLAEMARSLGLNPSELTRFSQSGPAMRTLFLDMKELEQERRKALRRFFLAPSYLLARARGIRSLSEARFAPRLLKHLLGLGLE